MKKSIVFILACILAVGAMLVFDSPDGSEPDLLLSAESASSEEITSAWIPDDTSAEQDDTDIVRGAYYYETDEVAYYLCTYGELPDNYITKSEAQALGWNSSEGNLWEVAPGMCIGGDFFGNYEGLLPTDAVYTECDVNYSGGFRGSHRLVFDDEGNIYYTADHYASFEQLYPQ